MILKDLEVFRKMSGCGLGRVGIGGGGNFVDAFSLFLLLFWLYKSLLRSVYKTEGCSPSP